MQKHHHSLQLDVHHVPFVLQNERIQPQDGKNLHEKENISRNVVPLHFIIAVLHPADTEFEHPRLGGRDHEQHVPLVPDDAARVHVPRPDVQREVHRVLRPDHPLCQQLPAFAEEGLSVSDVQICICCSFN